LVGKLGFGITWVLGTGTVGLLTVGFDGTFEATLTAGLAPVLPLDPTEPFDPLESTDFSFYSVTTFWIVGASVSTSSVAGPSSFFITFFFGATLAFYISRLYLNITILARLRVL
jgi:hypothetical protein